MAATIDLVVTCMGRLAHLRQALPTFVGQADTRVTVVDWSCPDGCGDWVAAHFPGVQVQRVPGQQNFNVSAARNHGIAAGKAPWLFMVDADVLLADGLCQQLLPQLPELAEGLRWASDDADPGLCGTTLVARADLAAVGGYDEVIQGWGGEDRDLYWRLEAHGVTEQQFPASALTGLRHDDADRTRHYAQASKVHSSLINALYGAMKRDVETLARRFLALEQRQALYQQAGTAVARAAAEGAVRVDLPLASVEMFGARISGALSYKVARLDP